MLLKLKRKIRVLGATRVASDLGYRSVNTLRGWIKNNKIPDSAKIKVKKYLEGKE